jgi:hypothetical protein
MNDVDTALMPPRVSMRGSREETNKQTRKKKKKTARQRKDAANSCLLSCGGGCPPYRAPLFLPPLDLGSMVGLQRQEQQQQRQKRKRRGGGGVARGVLLVLPGVALPRTTV